jgi:hypothetical protein
VVVEGSSRLDRGTVAATYVVLLLAGGMLGVIGTFLVPLRLDGVPGLSIALAIAGNVGAGLLGGLGAGSGVGAASPGVGWLITTGVLTTFGPGGDVILPGSLGSDPAIPRVGTTFLIVGIVAAVVPVVLTTRSARRAQPSRRDAAAAPGAAAPPTPR